MTPGSPTVAAYYAALLDYLLRDGEAGLTDAYDIGRSGFNAGCGLLQMLHIHERALRSILDVTNVDDETRRRVDASAKFLVEALSPFGLAADGYREFVKTR